MSSTTFSPDGRIFQVEYAQKAVDNSGTAMGLLCKDGVVLGVEKLVMSKMLCEGTSRRVHTVDDHAGMATAGLTADGRQLVYRARGEAENYENLYGSPIPGHVLAERLAGFVHVYTLYWFVRPFGAAALLATYDEDGPALSLVEPTGLVCRYVGTAIGKAKQAAKNEIEKLDTKNMTCREGAKKVAEILYRIHDEVKDKAFELELTWVCDESGRKHVRVPEDFKRECEEEAKRLEEMDED